MSWKTFEEECVAYLKRKYGRQFKLKGGSDSTLSDIFFNNGLKCFYIEAKMPSAQCGQFVLIPDSDNRIFKYSNKNKTNENEYTRMIVEFMNSNFECFCNSGTAGIDINMQKLVFYN